MAYATSIWPNANASLDYTANHIFAVNYIGLTPSTGYLGYASYIGLIRITMYNTNGVAMASAIKWLTMEDFYNGSYYIEQTPKNMSVYQGHSGDTPYRLGFKCDVAQGSDVYDINGSPTEDGEITYYLTNVSSTPPQTYSASAPTTISVSKSNPALGEYFRLSWSGASAGSDGTISGYEIYLSTAGPTTGFNRITTITTNSTSGSVQLEAEGAGSTQYYKIRTLGSSSGYNSGLSNAYATVTPASATTDPTGISLSPSSVTINVGQDYTLTATLIPSGSVDTVTWGTDDRNVVSVKQDPSNQLRAEIKGISPGKKMIVVRTTKKDQYGYPYEAACTVTVQESSTIYPPSEVKLSETVLWNRYDSSGNLETVTLSWTEAGGNVTGYQVQVCEIAGSQASPTSSDWANATVMDFNLSTLSIPVWAPTQPGNKRYYRVRSTNGGAYSAWRNCSSPLSNPGKMGPPSFIRITSDTSGTNTISEADANSAVYLHYGSGSPGLVNDIWKYEIQVRHGNGEWQLYAAPNASDNKVVTISVPGENATDYYRIRTVGTYNDENLRSNWTEVVAIKGRAPAQRCDPPFPAVLEKNASMGDAVKLSWAASSGHYPNDLTGYQVQRVLLDNSGNVIYGHGWEDFSGSIVGANTTHLYVTPPEELGNQYAYRVRALGSLGESYHSEWVFTARALSKSDYVSERRISYFHSNEWNKCHVHYYTDGGWKDCRVWRYTQGEWVPIWYDKGSNVGSKPTSIYVQSITITADNNGPYNVGDGFYFRASISPADATKKDVTWYSTDTNVVSIASTGYATIKGYGAATITASAADGSGVVGTYVISVQQQGGASMISVKIRYENTDRIVGTGFDIWAETEPASLQSNVVWSIASPAAAEIKDGYLCIYQSGSIAVTATVTDGKSTASDTYTFTAKPINTGQNIYSVARKNLVPKYYSPSSGFLNTPATNPGSAYGEISGGTGASSFGTTDFIQVSGYRGRNISFSHVFAAAFYDSDKKYIGYVDIQNTSDKTVQVPMGTTYVRGTFWASDALPLGDEVQIGPGVEDKKYVEYGNPLLTVTSYTRLCDAIYHQKNTDLVIKAGNYDIVDEYKKLFGNDIWEEMNAGAVNSIVYTKDQWMQGTPILNRILEFYDGVRVVCDFKAHGVKVNAGPGSLGIQGDKRFSALAVMRNAEIINQNLDCSGGYYCVHDDYGDEKRYMNRYTNCKLNLRHGLSDVIGGGLKVWTEIVIENCVITNGNETAQTFRYHSGDFRSGDFETGKAVVRISDCVISNKFSARYAGQQTWKSYVYVINCTRIYGGRAIAEKQSEGAGHNVDNIVLYVQ